MINVLLVDDQALFREGLSTILSVWDDINIIAEAGDGQEAIEQAKVHQPDVILMDIRMPVLDGVAATRQLQEIMPQTRIIVLTTFDDDEHIFEALRSGAAGYLLKDVSSRKLVEAIRTTARGESFLQPSVAAKVVAEFTRMAQPVKIKKQPLIEPLTKREFEILELVAGGNSNKEIATQLYITEGTVKNHLTNILGKLGVRDRTQAALKAKDIGLIS